MMLGLVLLAGSCRSVTAGPAQGACQETVPPGGSTIIYRYADLENYVR